MNTSTHSLSELRRLAQSRTVQSAAAIINGETRGDIAMKAYRYLELAGKSPENIHEELSKLPPDAAQARETMERYEQEAITALGKKDPSKWTEAQKNGFADILTTLNYKEKNWSPTADLSQPLPEGSSDAARAKRQREEEDEQRRLDELNRTLRELWEKQDSEGGVGTILGSYGSSGSYVRGTGKGGMLTPEQLKDLSDNYGAEGKQLADKYKAPLVGETARDKLVNFSRSYCGESEHTGNQGPLVAMCMDGKVNLPYCAGGIKMCTTRVLGDLFDQANWMQADSFRQIGEAYNATISLGEAKPGDIITFNGHVGMYTGNGKYLDFNGSCGIVAEKPLRGGITSVISLDLLAQNKEGKTLEEVTKIAQQQFDQVQKKTELTPAVTHSQFAAVAPLAVPNAKMASPGQKTVAPEAAIG